MRSNSGFTLIELILVTVIIGILAGMVTLTFAGRAEDARVRAAKGDIAMYITAIDLYALDNNDKYPPNLKALWDGERKYIREPNQDPWGNDYDYSNDGSTYKISCSKLGDLSDTPADKVTRSSMYGPG